MGEKGRQALLFLLVVLVTAGATLSYCRGDEGWRRPAPTPGVSGK